MAGRFGPAQAAKSILDQIPIDAEPKTLNELIADVVLEHVTGCSLATAQEQAEAWERQVREHIRREIEQLDLVGRPARVAFNSSSAYMLQGACYVERKDSEETRRSKLRRARSSEYYEAFDALSPTDFEFLCVRLIELLGVQDAHITRRSADEGIDFYGILPLENYLFPSDLTPTIQRQLSVWLVGQAKHYRNIKSGTPEVRDLMGAVALGRAKAFGGSDDPFSGMEIRVADPVLALLVTTGTFSSNAWRLLKRSGIVGMDGEMIAAFLADREAGRTGSAFSVDDFRQWVVSAGAAVPVACDDPAEDGV